LLRCGINRIQGTAAARGAALPPSGCDPEVHVMPTPGEPALGLGELVQLLQAAEPAALLVPPRLLRRVIKHDRKLTSFGLQVPHHKSYVITRPALLELTTPAELGISADRTLPATVLLLAQPEAEALAALPRGDALVACWRRLFHLRVHQAIAGRALTDAALRQRIHRIGQTEFDEVRVVLRQEKYLLPPRDDRGVYEEFAAVYLELSYFAATLLPRYFPAIEHLHHVEKILAEDVDAAALYRATRLAGAPEPVFPVDLPEVAAAPVIAASPDLAPAACQALLTRAEHVEALGNSVRAAILRAKAGACQQDGAAALAPLLDRLRAALQLSDAEAEAWRPALAALLPPAANGFWPAEARLLYDLQKACIAHERPVFAPDVVEWLYSGLRQPLIRPLPDQPLVLVVKHLRSAAGRVAAIRIDGVQQHRLAGLLRGALRQAASRLRERCRPALAAALAGVGLHPANFPEQVAQGKLIEELLDHITGRGFLNLGDLRDALSGNQLKLPDLAGAAEWLRGDPLLRINAGLAQTLPGIYRRGEVYLRGLQRGGALAFGTGVGRWLTLFVALPFAGAYGTIVFIQEMLHLVGLPHHLHAGALTAAIGGLGLFYLLLLHLPAFRQALARGWRRGVAAARLVVIDWPAALLAAPALRRFLQSWPVLLGTRFVLKPVPLAALVWVALGAGGIDPGRRVPLTMLAFLISTALINSRLGRDLEEALGDWVVRHWHYWRDVLPGLLRWFIDFFKGFLELVDRGIYTVDEWLRFRGGENRLTWAFKTVLSLGWFMVAYVIRLYLNVFVEPTINPVKHFPSVTVAAKLLVPFWIPLTEFLATPLLFLGKPLAYAIAFFNLHALPGAAGFLAWELKENWRLYRANRPPTVRPAAIGHHGETMLQLMKPGFHSGTLPKLYARLRRAERRALRSGDWRAPRQLREALHQVEHSVQQFAERELLVYLNGARGWTAGPVHLAAVEAGSNRVRLELACPALDEQHLELNFEEQSGWLLAHVSRPGWLPRLTPEQTALLTLVLTGFYQECGVDLVREQIEVWFPPPTTFYDLADAGLVVWLGPNGETEVVYDLRAGPLLRPEVRHGSPAAELPIIPAQQLLLSRTALPWQDWVSAWEQVQAGVPLPKPLVPGVRLLPGAANG